jgi:hypothetical protein
VLVTDLEKPIELSVPLSTEYISEPVGWNDNCSVWTDALITLDLQGAIANATIKDPDAGEHDEYWRSDVTSELHDTNSTQVCASTEFGVFGLWSFRLTSTATSTPPPETAMRRSCHALGL